MKALSSVLYTTWLSLNKMVANIMHSALLREAIVTRPHDGPKQIYISRYVYIRLLVVICIFLTFRVGVGFGVECIHRFAEAE